MVYLFHGVSHTQRNFIYERYFDSSQTYLDFKQINVEINIYMSISIYLL